LARKEGMMAEKQFFDRVYDLDDAEKTRALYSEWAQSYDHDLRNNNYATPRRTAEAMAAAVEDKTAPLLDLGCGTGLSGEAFRDAGFSCVDGSDFSKEMLDVARDKGLYRTLVVGDLNRPIPAEPGEYANIAAVGVFSPGHAPPEMTDAVVAVLPKGGCFGFSLNDHALEDPGYMRHIEALVEKGEVEIVFDEYGDHLPGIGLKSKVMVLKKL
jgi:predicted TPR repeat methyltransferase